MCDRCGPFHRGPSLILRLEGEKETRRLCRACIEECSIMVSRDGSYSKFLDSMVDRGLGRLGRVGPEAYLVRPWLLDEKPFHAHGS